MECKQITSKLTVETDSCIYEIEFAQIQVEITGICNMKCRHCRAANIARVNMPVDQIIKILKFGRQFSPDYKEVVLSGGEPLVHPQFNDVISSIRGNGGNSVTITTNGSLLSDRHLDLFESLNFQRLMLSVSLDSLDRKEHDAYRNYPGAYDRAVKAIKLIVKRNTPNVISSVRTTIAPDQIGEMEKMADFVYKLGCNRFSISSIIPSGRALDNPKLWMSSGEKRRFIEKVYELKNKYPPEFNITTNDPLKCLIRGFSDIGGGSELVFDGCPAAACTFNVNPNGEMTPCALMDLPIMNVTHMTIEEMTSAYQNSEVVKNMLEMNLTGKCGSCPKKYQCGGCRARAMAKYDNYLAEDPDCWAVL